MRYYGFEDSKYSDPTRCGLPTNELLPNHLWFKNKF